MRDDFFIDNVGIDADTYIINQFIKLSKCEEKTRVCFEDDLNDWYSDQAIFYYSLLICIPKVHLSIDYRRINEGETESSYNLYKSGINFLNSPMLNYYFEADNNFKISYIEINKSDIDRIKEVFNKLIEYNKELYEKNNNESWGPDRYLIAYNHYIKAYKCGSIEESIQNMITVLEALLVDGTGELSFRVSLYTSLMVETTREKRIEIHKLVKYMYDIRSKAVHGDIMAATKKLRNIDYDKYYRFKEIVAEVLIKTYGRREEDIKEALDNMIYSSGKFENYL